MVRSIFVGKSPRIANGAAPYRSAKPPTPQKCSGRVEVARNWVLGEVLREVLVLLVARRDASSKHFPGHFPEHPVSGRHLSEHSPPRSQSKDPKRVKNVSKSAFGDFFDTFLTLPAGRPGKTFPSGLVDLETPVVGIVIVTLNPTRSGSKNWEGAWKAPPGNMIRPEYFM